MLNPQSQPNSSWRTSWLPDERLVRFDPAPVELMAGEDCLRVGVPEDAVPADVVVVGMADQDEVRL